MKLLKKPLMYKHHDRLQQMLKEHAKVKEINEARQDEAEVINEKEDCSNGPHGVSNSSYV